MKRQRTGGDLPADNCSETNSSTVRDNENTGDEALCDNTVHGTVDSANDDSTPSRPSSSPRPGGEIVHVVHDTGTCHLCKTAKNGKSNDEELIDAVVVDDAQAVAHWLAMGADVDDNMRRHVPCPMFTASQHNSLQALRVLVQHGGDVNQLGKHRSKPIICASQYNSVAVTRELLRLGADVREVDVKRNTALIKACKHQGGVDLVTMLIEFGANVNATNRRGEAPLCCACRRTRLDIMDILLKHGADVHYSDKDGRTALFYACGSNSLEAIQWLVEHGVDLRHRDKFGATALVWCSGRESAEFLLRQGLAVDAEDDRHDTALMRACLGGDSRLDVVKCLVEHGADVNYVNKDGKTPLLRASGRELVDIMHYLIEHGADINHADNEGMTALARACLSGRAASTTLLLRHGAEVNTVDLEGYTPLMQAAVRSWRLTRMLLAHGADVHFVNKNGRSALVHAAWSLRASNLLELLRHGATLDGCFHAFDGYTIQSLSKIYIDAVRLLLRVGGRRLVPLMGHWLKMTSRGGQKPAIRMLASAMLVGRIG